ncbi:hypothetical protein ACLOJK_034083 [Asimina triloba]
MALKISGAHKQSKPSTGTGGGGGGGSRGQPACPDLEAICQGIRRHPYVRGGSTVPHGWDDFSRANRYQQPGGRSDDGGNVEMGSGVGVVVVEGRSGGEVVVEGRSGGEVVVEVEEEAKEWIAQVEPGVQITFLSLPQGGNDLKRIRFSREMFNKWEAQRWWGENYDRIMELYNVQRFNRQALPTPPRSEDERESYYSRIGSSSRESPATPPLGKERLPRNCYRVAAGGSGGGMNMVMMIPSDSSEYGSRQHHVPPRSGSSIYGYGGGGGGVSKAETSSADASRTTTSSRDEASISISNVSDVDTREWVEQDEPGVYITIRALPDGTRELRRVRFSRERFGEVHAKLWWEQNRERIQSQYL